MGRIHSRGLWRSSTLGVFLLAAASGAACGGGDDDSGAPANGAGTGGSSASSGGTDASGGATDSGGTGASGAKGGTAGTSGSSGSGSAGKGGGAGTTSGSGGSSAKGGTGGTSKGGTTASGGSGASTTNELLDEIGAACKTDCDAQFALDCAPQNTNSLTCQLSCAASTTQLGDFCLAEYRDYVLCRGDGGYDCVQTTPYPRSTCAVEQLAYSECTQHIGCKRFCEKTLNLGCNDTPFDDCVTACTSEMLPMPTSSSSSSFCAYQLETIAYCQATSATKCEGSALEMPAACASSVLNVAGCINDNSSDMCDGWCWAADRLGCGGSDCATDCATKTKDTTCGSKWNDLLDCVLFFGDAECSDSGLVGNGICDSEMSAYTSCMAGGTTN